MKNIYKYIALFFLILLPLAAIAASNQSTPYDKVTQGKSTATDKDYVFNIGAGAANPVLRGKASTNKLQFAHDGADFKDIGSGSGGGGGGVLINLNSGFEEGLTNWTASGGTFTLETTAANVGFATQAGAWNASAASQTLSNDAVTIPAGLYGKVCTLSWYYKGGDANLKAQVYDGTNVIAESSAFTTQADYSAKQVMYFTCPSSGTLRARFIASADAALVYIDDVKLGQEIVANGGGFQEYGTWYTRDAACGDGWQVSTAAYTNFTTDAGCPAPTVTGRVTAALTQIPGFIVADAGDYLVVLNGGRWSNPNASDGATRVRISDGTNVSFGATMPTTNISGSANSVDSGWTFLLKGVAAGATIQAQAFPKSGTTVTLHSGTASNEEGLSFTVFKLNSASVDTISVDKSGWRIDANIGGGSPSLGTSAVSSYAEIVDSSLDMVLQNGSAVAEIPCSTTNPSSGLTCAAGSEGVGLAFSPPSSGTYEVCLAFSHYFETNSSAVALATFQLVETPNNAQTILQEGGQKISSGKGAGAGINHYSPVNLCGSFTFNDTSKRTIRLMYEQLVAATITGNAVMADRNVTAGQRDIQVKVRRRVEFADVVRIASFTSAPVISRVSGNAGATAGSQPIIFPTVGFESVAMYSNGTGRWTVPAGKTVCSGRYYLTGDPVNNIVGCWKNGSKINDASNNYNNGPGVQNGTCQVEVTAGDLLDIRSNGTMAGNAAANASFTCW